MKKEKRLKIYSKFGGHCSYCGKKIDYKNMQVDHFIPKCRAHIARCYYNLNDINSISNLMPSCRRCNHYKRSYMPEKFRQLISTLHERVKAHYINKVAIDFDIITLKEWDGQFFYEKWDKLKSE